MKILVTGAAGQVGSELAAVPASAGLAGHEVVALTRADLDVTDREAVAGAVAAARPDAVVNCAAYNAVDAAEDEPDAATAVNAEAVGHLAAACRAGGAHLVHLSTDYVFDGTKPEPYVESDEPNPRSAYGRSKLAGEEAAREAGSWTVVRTAYVFGRIGRSLVEAVLARAAAGETLRMVTDQRASPTCAADLAAVVARLAVERAGGLFHVANSGECSPFELARDVLDVAGLDAPIEPITLAELGRPAERPRQSVLRSERLAAAGIAPLRHYRDALAEVVPLLVPAGPPGR